MHHGLATLRTSCVTHLPTLIHVTLSDFLCPDTIAAISDQVVAIVDADIQGQINGVRVENGLPAESSGA
jgi:hypothetical protein